MTPTVEEVQGLILLAQRELERPQPRHLESALQVKIGQLRELRKHLEAGDEIEVRDQLERLVAGQPKWASAELLDRLLGGGMIEVRNDPYRVTVHWELVPHDLRPAAQSLASEYVDAVRGKPVGGRGKKRVG